MIRSRTACTVALAAVCLLPPGCGVPPAAGPSDTFGIDFTPPRIRPACFPRGAVVFVVDGVNARVFEELLAAGELPAVERYFTSRGLYCPRAVANIPAVTMANLTTLVTGRFPGNHGVTGVNWFDRRALVYRDYATIAQKNTLDDDYSCPTVFERFAEPTVSIFLQPHRGADKFFENRISAGPSFFFGWYDFIDRITLHRFGEMMDIARRRFRRFPILTCAYLLSPDMVGYDRGVSADAYRAAVRNVSAYIGRVLGDLARAGLLDEVVVALVSDHGLSDVDHHFDLDRWLRDECGIALAAQRLWERDAEAARRYYYDDYGAVLNVCGDRYAALSLRRRDGRGGMLPWPARPSGDEPATGYNGLIEKLVALPAVDAVAWRTGPDRCRVRTGAGEAAFRRTDKKTIACAIRAGDPFGWSGIVEADAVHAPRRWLQLTAATRYPDLPAQILSYFDAPRAGDLAIFAAPGWDFGNTNRAGHGGIRGPEDLHVPLLLAGPRIPQGRIETARTADLVPTLLNVFGRYPPPGLDGRSLLAETPAR